MYAYSSERPLYVYTNSSISNVEKNLSLYDFKDYVQIDKGNTWNSFKLEKWRVHSIIPKEQHKTTVTIYVIHAPNTVIQTEKPGTWTQNQWHAVMKGMDWSEGTSANHNMSEVVQKLWPKNKMGSKRDWCHSGYWRYDGWISRKGSFIVQNQQKVISTYESNPLSNRKPLTQAVREIEPLGHNVNI